MCPQSLAQCLTLKWGLNKCWGRTERKRLSHEMTTGDGGVSSVPNKEKQDNKIKITPRMRVQKSTMPQCVRLGPFGHWPQFLQAYTEDRRHPPQHSEARALWATLPQLWGEALAWPKGTQLKSFKCLCYSDTIFECLCYFGQGYSDSKRKD